MIVNNLKSNITGKKKNYTDMVEQKTKKVNS